MLVVNEHIIMLYTFVNAGSEGAGRKPLMQMSEIINTEVDKSTDKGHVVVDAIPDYFRDNMIWSLLFFQRL
jgi:hypothetical protein